MKRQHLNPESFCLTLEIQKSILNFVKFYIALNKDAWELVKHLCYKFLPYLARIENKKISLVLEDIVRRMPLAQPLNISVDVVIVNQYK
jgi:hypothetical protein